MATQDELFQLVKSLTPSEKRYFKTNAAKGGDAKSNYVQLFDAIDSQGEEYDEELLKQKHAKKPFVKYLSAEKKYLREQVMKQMRAYRSDLSVDNKINELLQDEQFYRDKGLKQHREKTILKAKELATKYERLYLLQEILERQVDFVQEFEEKSLTEPVLRLHTELQRLSVNQQTHLDLSFKNREIFSAYRSGADIQDPIVRHRLDRAIAEAELLRSRTVGSFSLQQTLSRAYSNYYQFFRDNEKSYEYVLNEYLLYQENPQFKESGTYNYKICLANLISRAHGAKKITEFLQFIEEMKALPATNFNEDGEVFQNVYFLEHLHYINTGAFDKAAALIPNIEKGLVEYEAKINKARLLSFSYNIMVMYFLMHRFKDAAKWADQILTDKSEIKQGVTTVTRILLPIIHFELGHHDIVESLTRSAYRYLKEKKLLYAFEKLMINYLKNMPFSIDETEFKLKLNHFSKALDEMNEQERLAPGVEEINLWTKHRLGGQMMSDLILAH